MAGFGWLLIGILHLTALALTSALRLVMMDVPSPITCGESVELTCTYELEGDVLYSVKWYKNDVEFYRWVPNDWPPGQFLPLPGIRVDLTKSGKQFVFLRNVDLNSAGMYRCEISAEAPSFSTAEGEKEMQVFVLPTSGPTITGGKSTYEVGDSISVNCTSTKSKPAAKLQWYINDELAMQVGPDSEVEYSTTLHVDGLETSNLALRFVVQERHFRDNYMKLKCVAAIAKHYTMSSEKHIYRENHQTSGLHASEVRAQDMATIVSNHLQWTKMLIPMLVVLWYQLQFCRD